MSPNVSAASARPARRWIKWIVALVVIALIGLLVARSVHNRRAAQLVASAPKAVASLELAAADLVTARTGELVRTQNISGSLKAVNSAIVKARVAGELREINVREGDTVKMGQIVARLDPTEYEARLRQAVQIAAASKAQLDIAGQTYKNNQALVEQGFISKNALDTSNSSAASARANLASAEAAADVARKALADVVVRAPLSGHVSARLAQPGERIAVDGRLVEIVDISKLELEAALAPQDVAALQPGAKARLAIEGLADPVNATVARINPSTQAGTRAITVYLAVDNVAGLRQGLFARGTIELQRKSALLLPESAVRIDQNAPYVMAVEGDFAKQRNVTIGARGEADLGGGREPVVEVLAGVPEGARVLRGSVGLVRSGTPVRSSTPGSAPPSAPASSPAP
ncbi:efflux RND transporter periplasmic adaptor subunit [soil metagenome]